MGGIFGAFGGGIFGAFWALTVVQLAGLGGMGELEVVEVGVLLDWLKISSSRWLWLGGDVATKACAAGTAPHHGRPHAPKYPPQNPKIPPKNAKYTPSSAAVPPLQPKGP